jgi:hypothetical protein
VLAEQVSEANLTELCEDSVSYIFASPRAITSPLSGSSFFDTKTLLLEGGGAIDGSS